MHNESRPELFPPLLSYTSEATGMLLGLLFLMQAPLTLTRCKAGHPARVVGQPSGPSEIPTS